MNGIIASENEKFIVSMDVGTTNIKCHIFDQLARVRGEACQAVCLKI